MSMCPFEHLSIYPPGSKCEALQPGSPFNSLIFIRISLLTLDIFFSFGGWWMVDGVFFFVSMSFDSNMKRFEEPKSGHPSTTHHPPHTTDHQNKKKVSALKSEILIKYKRIKWTPSCKASLLLTVG